MIRTSFTKSTHSPHCSRDMSSLNHSFSQAAGLHTHKFNHPFRSPPAKHNPYVNCPLIPEPKKRKHQIKVTGNRCQEITSKDSHKTQRVEDCQNMRQNLVVSPSMNDTYYQIPLKPSLALSNTFKALSTHSQVRLPSVIINQTIRIRRHKAPAKPLSVNGSKCIAINCLR